MKNHIGSIFLILLAGIVAVDVRYPLLGISHDAHFIGWCVLVSAGIIAMLIEFTLESLSINNITVNTPSVDPQQVTEHVIRTINQRIQARR